MHAVIYFRIIWRLSCSSSLSVYSNQTCLLCHSLIIKPSIKPDMLSRKILARVSIVSDTQLIHVLDRHLREAKVSTFMVWPAVHSSPLFSILTAYV